MTAPSPDISPRMRLRLLLAAAVLAAGADFLTKGWAQTVLDGQPAVSLIGEYFRLRLGFNSGVAF